MNVNNQWKNVRICETRFCVVFRGPQLYFQVIKMIDEMAGTVDGLDCVIGSAIGNLHETTLETTTWHIRDRNLCKIQSK